MGTWGVGPFDNDCAGDLIAKFVKPVDIVATRKSNESASYHYNEARAAAQILLLAHGTDILGGPGLSPVVRALARMRADTEWIGGFRDPKKIAKALDVELDAAFNRIRGCGGCKKTYDKAEMIEMETLIKDARREPIPKPTRRHLPRRTTRARVKARGKYLRKKLRAKRMKR